MLRFRFNFEATRIDTFYLLYTDVCGLTGTEAWVGIYPGWLVNSTTCTVTGGLDCIPNIVFGHQLTFNLSAGIVIDSMHGLNTCSNTCAVRELRFSPVSAEFVSREIPNTVLLSQNYPNPFNPSTTIRYGLPRRSHLTLTVFNSLGQHVATLVQGEQEAGFFEAVFDASGFASGVYLYRLQAGNFVSTKTMLILK